MFRRGGSTDRIVAGVPAHRLLRKRMKGLVWSFELSVDLGRASVQKLQGGIDLDGQLLRQLTLDPTRNYQPLKQT
jgi:hypothetical protein